MNTKSRKGVQSLIISLRRNFYRVNSVSTPFGGFSYQPSVSERKLAQKLMKFLNNKRILYNLMEYEVLDHVVLSVQDVRKRLGEYLEEVDSESAIGKNMDSMQAACRTFLTKMQEAVDWQTKAEALGELRVTFLVELARLCVAYDVTPGQALVELLPILDGNDPQQDVLLKLLLREPIKQASTIQTV